MSTKFSLVIDLANSSLVLEQDDVVSLKRKKQIRKNAAPVNTESKKRKRIKAFTYPGEDAHKPPE